MASTLELVSGFSSKNDGMFNDKLIVEIRKKDEMTKYIDDACKAVCQLIPEYVKYLGYHYQDSRGKMLERDKDDEGSLKTANKNEIRININDTFAKEAIFDFECSFGGTTIHQSFSMWIPLLIDNSHFYIRGNKYSCPLQIIDAITFTKKNVLVLKTMTRAIKFERQKVVITDIFGKKYNTSKIMIYVTRKCIPVLIYFFAYFGFYRTLEYFGVDKWIKLYSLSDNEKTPDLSAFPINQYIFKFGQVYMGVDKQAFDENNVFRTFVATILASQKRSMDMDYIRNVTRWTMLLGESISIQKSMEKGIALLKTFNNSLDYHTREIISQLVPGTDRSNIYAVARWIFCNYASLTSKDDGLQNKRLRLGEYLISPFTVMFTEKIYRFMNTPDKLKTMDGLLDVFKIKSSLILNAIIGKISHQVTGLTIAKFSSECNDDALTNTLLMVTKTGPGSPSAKSKRVSTALRQFPIDYIGAINFIEGQSAGAPGLSHFICPCNQTFNMDKMTFEIDPVLIKK